MYNVKLYTTSADYVYQQLRHRIITKQLRPGQRLPEVALASQFEVSRTPVREALRRLASEGLVLLIPNSGARVSSPTRSEIEDAYAVREYLESLAVKLAVNTISESQLGRIDDAVAAEEKAFAERNL